MSFHPPVPSDSGPIPQPARCPVMQRKLAINEPGDRYEQEADRVADSVMGGGPNPAAISAISGNLQRDDQKPAPKPDNYDEAVKKALAALQETAPVKELKAKAETMGKDFLSTVEGKVIVGTALTGALAGLIATNSELPVGIPELPLDFIAPGLKAKVVWEGPVRNPTSAGLVLTTEGGTSFGAKYTSTDAKDGKPAEQSGSLSLSFPLGGSPAKKNGPSDTDKIRAETARMAADQAKFREGLKTPDERAQEKEFLDSYLRGKMNDPLNPLALPGFGKVKKNDDFLQRKSTDAGDPAVPPPVVDEVLGSSGEPLADGTRSFMEERMGRDFGDVRVHRDSRADRSAQAVSARAYTVGRDIVFRAGEFSPESAGGRRLLAHELAHVVQQGAATAALQRKCACGGEASGGECAECRKTRLMRAPATDGLR